MKKIMQTSLLLIPLLAITLLSMRCRKNKNEPEVPKTELEKLPPITQTGANTFGCLVNGVAWLPNGTKPSNGGPNIQVYVDPTFQGGRFGISGHKYNENAGNTVDLLATPCIANGQYFISQNNLFIQYGKRILNNICEISSNEALTSVKNGTLNITKYDLTNRIFSGTFEATLYNPSTCTDTIKITNGRFDVKL
jgi:hypothetical protein